jgi:uncharacterized protein (TIGR02186 family)
VKFSALIIAVALIVFPTLLLARSFTADVHLRSIYVDHSFSGVNVLMYGSQEEPGNIVVSLRGPEENFVVRKKSKIGGFSIAGLEIGGIWANTQSMSINSAPTVYGLASHLKDLSIIQNRSLLEILEVGIDNIPLDISEDEGLTPDEKQEFKGAFIEYMQRNGVYSRKETLSPISFWASSLFRTDLKFPKNIEDGKYGADIYLFSPDGLLTSMQSFPIEVQKVGFEAYIYDLAHKNSKTYGALCVIIAIFAGWFASAVLGQVRR